MHIIRKWRNDRPWLISASGVIALFLLTLLTITLATAHAYDEEGKLPHCDDADCHAAQLTLTGILTLEWSDPLPLGSGPGATSYYLISDAGRKHELFLEAGSPLTPSDMLAWNRRRVSIEVDAHGALKSAPQQIPAALSEMSKYTPTSDADDRRWVTIACKFSDIPAESRTVEYFRDMYRSTKPGLNHYWPEISYGNAHILGGDAFAWFDLPHPWSHYAGKDYSDTKTGLLFEDCTAAADAAVYFPNYDAIHLFFNNELAQARFAMAGAGFLEIDGVPKLYDLTWEGTSGYENIGTVYHEMGHLFNWNHSYDSDGYQYGNAWDVMSNSDYTRLEDPKFGNIGQNTLAANLNKRGWIPVDRKHTFYWPGTHTLTMERLSLPQTGNYLLVEIPYQYPLRGSLMVEARRLSGYDSKLPGDAIIIHRKDENGSLHLVDKNGGDSGDEGAMWRVTESYVDPDSGVQVTVDSQTATGFVTTIKVPDMAEPNDTAGEAFDLGDISYSNDFSYRAMIAPAGDVDFYKFDYASFDKRIRIKLEAEAIGSFLDPYLVLYREENGNLVQVAQSDNLGSDLDPQIVYEPADEGTYTIKIQAAYPYDDGGADFFYEVSLLSESDPHELNDHNGGATPIALGSIVDDATIGLPGDQDFYSFHGSAGDEILVDIDAASLGSTMDPILYLYDAKMNLLVEMDNVDSDDLDPFLRYPLPADGDYTLLVREFNHGEAGGIGYYYRLFLDLIDAGESNDTANQATPIAYGDVRRYELIHDAQDLDFYAFTAEAGDLVRAEVDANDLGSPLNAQIFLFRKVNGELVELAANDDQGFASLDPSLFYDLPADDTYYLLIKASESDSEGGPNYYYHLSLYRESDPNELNDYFVDATQISYGTVVRNATIGVPGDLDYYVFYGSAGDEIVVHIDSEGIGTDFQANLTLLDSALVQLAYGDYGYDDYGPHVQFTLAANDYYFLLVNSGNYSEEFGPDHMYHLWLNAQDAHEPNETAVEAAPIVYGDRNRYGIIGLGGDRDYYAFTGKAGDLVRAEIVANDLGSHMDPQLFLYQMVDGSLVVLAESDNEGFASLDPRFVHKLPADDTYYLEVRAGNSPDESWREFFYFLSLYEESDPNELNDYIADATKIDYGEIIDDATIGVPGDQDYYYFYGEAGDKIAIDIDAASIGSELDAVLCLQDGALYDLACSDNRRGSDPYITITLPRDDYYLLLVTEKDHGNRFGPSFHYHLKVAENWLFYLPAVGF